MALESVPMRSGTSATDARGKIEIVGIIDHEPGVEVARQRRSSASGARSPSMENTPSVTISARW